MVMRVWFATLLWSGKKACPAHSPEHWDRRYAAESNLALSRVHEWCWPPIAQLIDPGRTPREEAEEKDEIMSGSMPLRPGFTFVTAAVLPT